MQLALLDWIIIIAYFAITIGVGLKFSGRAGRSITEYFISGRSLPWWIAGTSMVATTFAADTPLAVAGLVAVHGVAGNWVWWSMAAGGMFTVFVFARLWRRAEVITDVELTEIRYSGAPAAWLRGIRAVYVALIINPIIIGWVTGAMVTILKEGVFADVGQIGNVEASAFGDKMIILACLAVVGVYATLSGMWGVAITDVIQFVTAMVGCILLAIVAVNHVGGVDVLHDKITERYGEQVFNYLPDFTGSSVDLPEGEDATAPSESNEAEPWMPLHIFCIIAFVQWWATWYPGAEPGGGGYVVQRMAACKDERHAVLATLWYQIAHYCLRPWPWLIVAFAAMAIYPEMRELAVNEDMQKELNTKADAGFVWVMRDVSPVGLRGLMLVTFFAAFMSTISTQMNWGASYLVRDVYQRFVKPDATDKQLASMSRVLSIVVLIAGALASFVMVGGLISVDEAWKILLALGAGTGAVYMLRWYWWRINAWSEIVAMLGSLFFFLLFNYQFKLLDNGWKAEEQILLIAGCTIVAWFLATMLTSPESDETLTSFFRKTRPGGPGWKRIAALVPDVEPDQHLGLSILAALAASGIVYCTIPGIGLLIFGQVTGALGCFAGAAVFAGLVAILMKKIGWKNVV